MKKLMAFICILAMLLSLMPVSVPQAAALDLKMGAYQVGYARVDINPYVVEDDPTSGIMALPLRGEGDVWNRLSDDTLLDDNGDGMVNENDGLKVTCIAISDDAGKTVLMITMDLIGGTMVDQVRPAVIERVNTAIVNGELTGIQELTVADVYVSGTHTHSAPDTGAYSSKGKTGTNNDGVDLSVVNENLGIWIDRTVVDVCDAAMLALKDRAAAQLNKDQLSVSDATSSVLQDKSMASTRHYNTDVDGVEFVAGDGFNSISASDYANPSDYRTTRGISPKQVTVADDTIYLLQFAFEDSSKLPIILTSWRGHPSLNNRNGYKNCSKTAISSDYINAYRHALEYGCDVTFNTANGYLTDWTLGTTRKYRVAFFTGTGGNVNTRNFEQITYHGTAGDVLQRGYTWIEGSAKSATVKGLACSFGVVLATLAQECLSDGLNETAVNNGKIQTAQLNYYAARKTTGITQLSYNAALDCQAAMAEGSVSYPYRYTDPQTGEIFLIGGRFHPGAITRSWSKTLGAPITTPVKVELGSILLGQDVAFVSVPAEPFDFYYKDTTLTGDAKFAPENNLWNELINNDTYGKPFVLGYCNGLIGYFPNHEAYIYGEGSTEWTVGSYEAYSTNVEQGTGENMVRAFDQMLTTMSENGGMTYAAACAHCGENQTWEPYDAQTTLTTGHYYLCTDTQTAPIKITGGQTVCIDLKGHTLTGETRVLYTSDTTRDVLNIMDSSEGQTGVIQGCGGTYGGGSGFGGGTILISESDQLNLYSGTLTSYVKVGYSTSSGGVLRIRGTFNMYGGNVTGGTASSFTGSYLSGSTVKTTTRTGSGGNISLTGTMNLYGGEITDGKLNIITGTVTESESGTYVYSQTAEDIQGKGPCVYVEETGVVNLRGNAKVDQLHFADGDGLSVIGNYTGSAELKFNTITELTDLTKVGNALADEAGVAANTTFATVTFTDAPGMTTAVKGTDLIVSDLPYAYGTCQVCGECRWQPITDAELDAWGKFDMPPGHYVLTEDVDTVQKQLNYNGDRPGTVCLDLNGHTFTGASRSFLVYADVRLNIFDSAGGGIMNGQMTTGSGGVIYAAGGEVHLYGGTVQHLNTRSDIIKSGGAVYVNAGNFNIHGGTVKGFPVSSYGGTIYVANGASFTADGGQIIKGTATTGDGVYISNGCFVTLSGDANIDLITFGESSADTLTVGGYTGSVQLQYPSTLTLTDGTVIGTVSPAGDLSGAEITVVDLSCKIVAVSGETLVVQTQHTYQAVITAPTCTEKGYTTYTCDLCGDVQVQNIPATGHSHEAKVTAPTCTEGGYTIYTCFCGDSYISDETAAAGHSYRGGVCTVCHACQACGECQWTPITNAQLDEWGKYDMPPGHYVLTEDVSTVQKQLNYNGDLPGSFCIDLSGHTYTGGSRAFVAYADTRLNIMDSVGDGVLNGQMVTGSGGVIYIAAGQVHLYSGTVQQLNTKSDSLKAGGAVQVNGGSFHLHGGTVMGFPVSTYGGAVFLNNGASFVTDGGQILAGTAGTTGDCVYISEGCRVALSGDANIDLITFGVNSADTLTMESSYTGTVVLEYPNTVSLTVGTVIGTGNLEGASISLKGLPCLTVSGQDGALVLIEDAEKHIHQEIITDPTCTEDGYTTYTCATCGDTKVEVIPAAGHSFENGTCGTCGESDPDYVAPVVKPTIALKSPTLEFKDMICIVAFYTVDNTQDVVEMGMITYKEKVDEWNVETADYVIPGANYDESSGRYYSSSQGIHAKYLADTVYLACYAKLSDGSYVYTKLAPYSPITYATNQLKNSTNTQLKQLVAAMLNYGAEAQMYFGHNTESLANASMTAEQLALPETYREDMVSAVPAAGASKQGTFANNKGFSVRKPAISFEGAFCINYFFTPAYAPVDGITLYYWNEADFNATDVLTVENASGSLKMEGTGTEQYRGDIVGISAKNLSQAVYVAAVYSDGTTTWTSGVLGYSIGAYCSSKAAKGGDIAGLTMATAVYGYHAKQYFG